MLIKKSLLEYLIRECAQEVLAQVREAEDTKGAPAPPADGTGSGDNLGIPQDQTPVPQDPALPETPPTADQKGILVVSPRDHSKLEKVNVDQVFADKNPNAIKAALSNLALQYGGRGTVVASQTVSDVSQASKNPNTSLYLYISKIAPEAKESYLMSDRSLAAAKAGSVGAIDVQPAPYQPFQQPEPQQQQQQVNENLKKVIKKMVSEIINK